MYVRSSRVTRSRGFFHTTKGYPWAQPQVRMGSRPTKLSVSYSWRTGKSAKLALERNPSINSVFVPQGNLAQKLSNRKRFIEDMLQTAALSSQSNDYTSPDGFQLASDSGHSFWTTSFTSNGARADVVEYGTGGWYAKYTNAMFITPGLIVPAGPWGPNRKFTGYGLPETLPPSISQLTLRKQQLFNSARPDASVSGVGETLYELFTGQWPRLLTSVGKRIAAGKAYNLGVKDVGKYAGEAYLNSVFQWKPIIEDMVSLIEYALNATDLLHGAEFRRKRFSQPEIIQSTFKGTPDIFESINGRGLGSLPIDLPGTVTYRSDTHLSAKFSKAKPTIGTLSMISKAQDALQILGIWTPSLGWDILPFSWLVDWFFHIGRGFENASTYSTGNGSYHINYAYATHKTSCVVHRPATFGRNNTTTTSDIRWGAQASVTVSTSLWRERASPWGFGLDLSKLSQGQWHILTALGLARAR